MQAHSDAFLVYRRIPEAFGRFGSRSGAAEEKGLENKTNFLVSDPGKCFFIFLSDGSAVEDVFSAGRGIQTPDDIHECRFAGTRRTKYSQKFAFFYSNADAF